MPGARNGAIKILPIQSAVKLILSIKYNTENIPTNTWKYTKTVRCFDWEKAFGNLSVDRIVDLVNETLLNVLRNYIPNKKIKFNYCQPPWMNDNIKRCLIERSKLTKLFYNNGQKREGKEKLEAKATYCTE